MMQKLRIYVNLVLSHFITPRIFRILCPNIILTEGYEYGSFHFLEPSFLHNYTDSTLNKRKNKLNKSPKISKK
ncbi:putative ankyrin-repeat containing protein [Paenibacillus phage BN12]|uniref:Putative ankyrin-repeat containing protein n=1 Tax=Paenibacillus phage BN12 TaxID=2070189 RepID=A0A2I7SCM7_9CAUD|nr:putative ankyrin-repeat containing protein [Paenibacillus phage BN12]AUS03626.1 putative ankyrin-repeat containing protein [Paenibacillus phage BN12]